ncbi:c-type cytochrome biogenesis protein CcmI [Parapusillimonas sp. JC17]|uniref:c-type cytochrome biogenesis protein CcmI n=1 Tax=Parapusillimonas sp. JC17 TaxID=3445768 RepID=UPI003F9F1A4A
MSLTFIAIAALLVFSVTVPLGLALLRDPRSEISLEHQAVNAAVLRDQLEELEQDLASGTLSPRAYTEAKRELQRRTLEEVESPRISSSSVIGSNRAAIALFIVLPVGAVLTYLALGNPAATNPKSVQVSVNVMQPDVQAMVNSLSERLEVNPDDPDGWLMLARSYRYLERYKDAAIAFANATSKMDVGARVLSEYAETLARSSTNGFNGQPTQLLEEALSLDPNEPFALTLAGTAALERRDYGVAIEYWQRLIALLPTDSDAARAVQNSIDRARRAKGQAAPK